MNINTKLAPVTGGTTARCFISGELFALITHAYKIAATSRWAIQSDSISVSYRYRPWGGNYWFASNFRAKARPASGSPAGGGRARGQGCRRPVITPDASDVSGADTYSITPIANRIPNHIAMPSDSKTFLNFLYLFELWIGKIEFETRIYALCTNDFKYRNRYISM